MKITEHHLAAAGGDISVLDLRPEREARAVAVVGHAMMVDRRTVWHPRRPSLAQALVARGIRALVPDLRGHGASNPAAAAGGRWRYDDLVADTARYVALASSIAPGQPVHLVGHSLFGHTSLAYLARNPDAPVAAVVAIAVHLWAPRWTLSPTHRMLKRVLLELPGVLAAVCGFVPVRAARMGSADESAQYWQDLADIYRHDAWRSADGFDYHAALAGIRQPVLHVLSEGDWFLGNPSEAALFLGPLGHRRELLVGAAVPGSVLGSYSPTHMALLTDARAQPLWDAIANWLLTRAVAPPDDGAAAADPAPTASTEPWPRAQSPASSSTARDCGPET